MSLLGFHLHVPAVGPVKGNRVVRVVDFGAVFKRSFTVTVFFLSATIAHSILFCALIVNWDRLFYRKIP